MTLDHIAHLIQVALTPVFLLSGIAALLNTFATRLARVSDRLDTLTHDFAAEADHDGRQAAEIRGLHLRSRLLDVAVVLGATSAAATCLAIITLFLSALRSTVAAGILLSCFGGAIVFAFAAVIAFGAEMLVSSRGARRKAPRRRPPAEGKARPLAHGADADKVAFGNNHEDRRP